MADQDILIGPGKIWKGPTGEANPDETTVAYGAAWGGTWVDVGDFLEGQPVSLSMPEDFVEVYTERSTAPVNAVRTRRKFSIKTVLAEHSVVNMALLLGSTAASTAAGASQKGYSDLPIGSSSAITFYKIGIEGLRKTSLGVDQPVRYFFHKAYIKLTGDVKFAKQEATGIPIEIVVLADRSQSAGNEMGLLQIVTAAATS